MVTSWQSGSVSIASCSLGGDARERGSVGDENGCGGGGAQRIGLAMVLLFVVQRSPPVTDCSLTFKD